jgi:hypothetical protein
MQGTIPHIIADGGGYAAFGGTSITLGSDIKPAVRAASTKVDRVVGTRPPDPVLLKAMMKVGIEAASIDDTGRLSVAQLERIKGTADSTSGKIQLTRLADLAGLLPVELQAGRPVAAASTSAAAFAALPMQLKHVMKRGGLQQEFEQQGGLSVAHIDAAAADVGDKIMVKLALGRLGLLSA